MLFWINVRVVVFTTDCHLSKTKLNACLSVHSRTHATLKNVKKKAFDEDNLCPFIFATLSITWWRRDLAFTVIIKIPFKSVQSLHFTSVAFYNFDVIAGTRLCWEGKYVQQQSRHDFSD